MWRKQQITSLDSCVVGVDQSDLLPARERMSHVDNRYRNGACGDWGYIPAASIALGAAAIAALGALIWGSTCLTPQPALRTPSHPRSWQRSCTTILRSSTTSSQILSPALTETADHQELGRHLQSRHHGVGFSTEPLRAVSRGRGERCCVLACRGVDEAPADALLPPDGGHRGGGVRPLPRQQQAWTGAITLIDWSWYTSWSRIRGGMLKGTRRCRPGGIM
jgi:hypothetical protein